MASREELLRELAKRANEEMRKYGSPKTEQEHSISFCLYAICVMIPIIQAEKAARKRKSSRG